jgi:hypothetical protein
MFWLHDSPAEISTSSTSIVSPPDGVLVGVMMIVPFESAVPDAQYFTH